jgi:selenium metabolism protein YedF
MSRKTVDARGMLCPKPLILTKKALAECGEGEEMVVRIDNETSMQNVERFLRDNGMDVSHTEEAGVYTLNIVKTKSSFEKPDAQSYCSPAAAPPHAVCFTSDVMGRGNDELGRILMKAFINTIGDVAPLPGAMLFYNRGIFLALEESPVVDTLNALAKSGVKILVCGTCADYFRQKQNVAVGTISNMYDILEELTKAGKVIYP